VFIDTTYLTEKPQLRTVTHRHHRPLPSELEQGKGSLLPRQSHLASSRVSVLLSTFAATTPGNPESQNTVTMARVSIQ
jgi:hypothetical protein